jgi:hypothetical protein
MKNTARKTPVRKDRNLEKCRERENAISAHLLEMAGRNPLDPRPIDNFQTRKTRAPSRIVKSGRKRRPSLPII